MNILGISDTITDSGIAYSEKGKLIMAVNEERFTRKKTQGGFPDECLSYFLNNHDPKKVDLIVVGGILTPTLLTRAFPKLGKQNKQEARKKAIRGRLIDFLEYKLKINSRIKPDDDFAGTVKKISKKLIRKSLPKELESKPIELSEHHLNHAAATYFCSGFENSLVVTLDGFGDGFSAKIYSVKNSNFKEVFSADALDSFGLFYSLITALCGYKQHRHEGKITGLAAFGDAAKINIEFPFEFNEKMELKYTGSYGKKGIKNLKKELKEKSKEDISAWVQKNTEKYVCKLIDYYLKETGHKNVALAGGVTANVKLNQRIHELDNVENIYIYPAMSDAGLSHGAILAKNRKKEVINNIYYGPEYSNQDIENELEKNNLNYKKYQKIENKIAKIISQGKIVARFSGRMEYGPRALGNRTIMVQATDPDINRSLNKKLDRTEFMPFAPVILEEYADRCIKDLKGAELTSKFMNISFDVTDYMEKNCPAAVHVDKTARPQILSKNDNPGFHKILMEYYEITGLPAMINTSFNAHGEPIVRTPKEAIQSFLNTDLDFLAINNFLVEK